MQPYQFQTPYLQLNYYLKLTFLTESEQGPHEKRLLIALLNQYNTLERPVANESDPLDVKFGLTLQQIIDVVCTLLLYTAIFVLARNSNLRTLFLVFL